MNTAKPLTSSRSSKPSPSRTARGRPTKPRRNEDSPSRVTNAPAARGHAVRVLCVDDHAVLVEGLAARFALEAGIELVGRLAGATRLLEECDRLKPDVVILDIEMPGPDAFEVAGRLKHRPGAARVMVLSAHIRDAFISAAFRAGASAYFSKADDLADIVRGIFEVARSRPNEFLLGPKVRDRCRPVTTIGKPSAVASTPARTAAHEPRSARSTGTSVTLLSSLTGRETEILRFIGKGMSRTQIASELCRSAKTVDAHQARMMKKLGITARADLMRYAIREGLAEA